MTIVQPRAARSLVVNSISLLGTTHITALLGYVFWMLCARSLSAEVVGVANTVISAMTLVSIVVVSGFLPMLTRLLPGASPEERSGLCSTAFLVSAVASGIAGVGAALLMPQRLTAVVGTGWLLALLGTGAVSTALLLVVNAALLGVRRAELSLFSGVVGSVSRLAAIAVATAIGVTATGVGGSASHTVLVIWIVSAVVSLVLSVVMLATATPSFRFHPHWSWFTRMRSSLGWDYMATLAVRAPMLAIPILASAHFPPTEIGYLAVVVLILGAFLAVAASVSNSLLADCAHDPRQLQAQARRASRLIALLLFVPVLVACLLAKVILGFFGPDYADYSPLLILCLLSTFPDALINVRIAVLRVQCRLPVVAVLTVAGAVLSVGGAWLLMPSFGILGAGVAVFTSQTIIAGAFAVVGRHWFQGTVGTDSDEVEQDVLTSDVDQPIVPTPRQFWITRRTKLWTGRQ